MDARAGGDPDREFWVGMRNTYIQQIRLIQSMFTSSLVDRDGVLVMGVVMALEAAVVAIERRFGLRERPKQKDG